MKHIAIVGGGTAGWMAAVLFAHIWRDFSVTLVEAPDIPTVGVGEGSTPALKKYFDFLGIAESEWMAATGATYKTGIRFAGWSGRADYPDYFHAFDSALDLHTEPAFLYNCDMRRLGIAVQAHPDDYFINARLAAENRVPVPDRQFPFATGYGYHFDAGRLAGYLSQQAAARGVLHSRARVTGVPVDASGIARLQLDSGETLVADLYVDCTGFSAHLLQGALAEPFVSYEDQLLNDRAVVIGLAPESPAPVYTRAEAADCGWIWKIPLAHRTGYGYVYSSRFCSPAQAEQSLRRHLGVTDAVPARHLTMRVGRRARHWVKNCLALGLSQGFIEPLEATALNLVQTTIEQFADSWELSDFTDTQRQAFNQRVNDHFDGVRDYIVAHYLASARRDTPYWQAATAVPASDPLAPLLQAWHQAGDLRLLLKQPQYDRFYAPMSWYSLLSGYGCFLPGDQLRPGSDKANRFPVQTIRQFLSACATHYPGVGSDSTIHQ
ncbi:tryptophan halogenase family protein [Simiduia agarivorans]|uniref:Tryptophan halogenase n=1 Tax=Simiduia agarivorans (strain DSM 21679 / JCM 13881 / BCRC 17597 / SA1) TaxID=1117647 RepID=K4KIY7_SIMAS|nr:tryptophan halogenase family protein [Simiduia agarivorans]AFU99114.1 tryptophan halogenase [Simiduia agarivorans SA1 = DSM 21679]